MNCDLRVKIIKKNYDILFITDNLFKGVFKMKKGIMLLMVLMLLITACTTDNLSDYKNAIKKTEEIDKGRMNLSIKTALEFKTEGLTDSQIRDLSYFEQMEFAMDVQYDDSSDKEKVIAKSYCNFGGMGFDMGFYFNGEKAYMKMPIIEKYMSLDDFDTTKQEEQLNGESYENLFQPILNKWNELLQQENVFKGKKTYVLTDEGQIKTTTYTIEASEEQLKAIGDELIRVIKEEEVVESFIRDGMKNNNFSGVEDIDPAIVIKHMEEYVERMVLESFKGTAYVDFDGRLIKEIYEVQINWLDAKKGEPISVNIEFENNYSHLGEEQVFEFPTVKEDEWINFEDLNQESFFPEGIF